MTIKGHAPGSWLDCRVPPPVVALVAVGASWALARWAPPWPLLGARSPWPLVVVLLLLAGAFGIGGVQAFRRERTSLDPRAPARASSLVVLGPYRYTRNPMYLALALALLAWCAWLANPAALAGPVLFAAYLTRWQIIPEERAMREKFGDEYQRYRARVRRWI